MSQDHNSKSDLKEEGISRKGCLSLFIGGILFIGLMFSILFYMASNSRSDKMQANEKAAVLKCFERAEKTDRKVDKDKCIAMEGLFTRKYGSKP